MSWQKELDADAKAIQQQQKIVGHLKKIDGINANGTQSMFILTILEKTNEMRLEFSAGNVAVL